ncbi:hypothetical protein MANES_03G084200v8 [Manihot esculenta]|uniref:Uncharacterized protein n=1 Tax=Manihot esculenta TaxID=3983 RepID=A0ACB7HYF7_MANES|nr:hypothetical protein MANES_03G084200v8 [Manihot esculenta]
MQMETSSRSSAVAVAVAIILGIIVTLGWRVLNWVWFRPKKLERFLRKQGIAGNPYRFFHGDLKQSVEMIKQARSQPFDFSQPLALRVAPFLLQTLNHYGKNSFIWIGPAPRVNITNPEHIKEVFAKINEFQRVKMNPQFQVLAPGLASYEGHKWAKHRKIINPAFHLEKLKLMLPLFHECCIEMIEKWKKLISSMESCELDVWPYLQDLSRDCISRAAFGSNHEQGQRVFQLLDELAILIFQGAQSVYIPGWSKYPHWQAQAREEVLQVFGGKRPQFDGLNRLKVVTMILYEVLRLYSPGTTLSRTVYEKTRLGDLILPAGVQITVPVCIVHQDPELWGKDALEFKPQRFFEGVSKATKNQVSFFPFGWGPRICIGQNFSLLEAKMALAMILQHFSFQLSSSYSHAPRAFATLRPEYGAQLIFRKI